MGTIDEIYYKLGKNLLRAALFYFPKGLLELAFEGKEEKAKMMEYADRLFLIEKDGSNYFVEDESTLEHILSKQMVLDDNIMLLYQWKDTYGTETFNYILDRYLLQLKAYERFMLWFCENAGKDVKDLKKDDLKALKLQHGIFKGHNIEVRNRFQDNVNFQEVVLVEDNQVVMQELLGLVQSTEFNDMTPIIDVVEDKPKKKSEYLKELREKTMIEGKRIILKGIFNVVFKDEI